MLYRPASGQKPFQVLHVHQKIVVALSIGWDIHCSCMVQYETHVLTHILCILREWITSWQLQKLITNCFKGVMIFVSFFHGIHKTQIKTVAVDEIISISVPNMASCYELTSGLFSRSWATEEMQLVFTGRIELPMIMMMLMNPFKGLYMVT